MNTSNNIDSSSTPREILNEDNFDIWAYELRTNLEISHRQIHSIRRLQRNEL